MYEALHYRYEGLICGCLSRSASSLQPAMQGIRSAAFNRGFDLTMGATQAQTFL